MASENIIRQEEEVVALSAIYGKDWSTESKITRSYSIRINDKSKEIMLYVTLPPDYPALTSPKYELSAPWMERQAKRQLYNTLNEIYQKNIGESIIYLWVEKIREVLQQIRIPKTKKGFSLSVKEKKDNAKMEISVPDITHGKVIVDRKSIFQGHAAKVHSVDEVNAVIAKLKENKKIANATHNMYAYIIEYATPKGTVTLHESHNDGEAQAGGRMLNLLKLLEQKCTLVVVSRWHGGIQLGPDRFRHINNATRQVIEQAGLLVKK